MKNFLILLAVIFAISSCQMTPDETSTKEATMKSTHEGLITVTEFKGQQVTGVTCSKQGHLFVNFPRWRKGVTYSVCDLDAELRVTPFPYKAWNHWEIGDALSDTRFVAVQSVVAHDGKLYVLDTRNPQFKGVLDAPRIFVFDIQTRLLKTTYVLSKAAYHPDSYINDLRIDAIEKRIYCTDSGHGGLVIIDLLTGTSRRIFDGDPSTTHEQTYLTFDSGRWDGAINSDGIAFSQSEGRIYFHALTGYSLYSVATKDLDADSITPTFETKTGATDGMILDGNGNLYFADLEQHKVQYRTSDGTIKTLVETDSLQWADTFTIFDGYLYFTDSKINQASDGVSDMSFPLYKIKLP